MSRLNLVICLSICFVFLAFGAQAQDQINFSNLPLVDTPSPMPAGYGRLNWANFFYVNPYAWSGAGPGFHLQSSSADVAFVGGEFCGLSGYTCTGSINFVTAFQLLTAQVAGGYGPTAVTVRAYRHGTFVGTQRYVVTPQVQNMNFPLSWGAITEVIFEVTGEPGSLVIYDLTKYDIGG